MKERRRQIHQANSGFNHSVQSEPQCLQMLYKTMTVTARPQFSRVYLECCGFVALLGLSSRHVGGLHASAGHLSSTPPAGKTRHNPGPQRRLLESV